MVGVCALVKKAADGSCEDVRIGLTNMGSTPLRASAAEEALRGRQLDAGAIAAAAEQAAEGTEPPGDLNATPDYKRHLARVLTRRALEAAAEVVSARQPRSRPGGPGRRALPRRPGPLDVRLPGGRRSSSRCCWRARPAWARPRWPRRSPRPRARA